MEWNKQQQEAIETCWIDKEKTKRCNILVNAAAGSGKTAVLVERIIRKIEKPDGSSIDRLLVVTFTKAAAAEMQQKINRAIVKRLTDNDGKLSDVEKAHLIKQLRLLQSADICNIDSYCIRVVRNNFHILGIDPNFSPISGNELMLMKEEAMDLLFEELYENEDPEKADIAAEFLRLNEMFSGTYGDRGLAQIIAELYNFTTSLPDPENWLTEKYNMLKDVDLFKYCSNTRAESDQWLRNSVIYVCTIVEKILTETKAYFEKFSEIPVDCIDNSDAENNTPVSISEFFESVKIDLQFNDLKKLVEDVQAIVKKFPPESKNPVYLRWGNLWKVVCKDFETIVSLYLAPPEEVSDIAEKSSIGTTFPDSLDKLTASIKRKKVTEYLSDNLIVLLELKAIHKDYAKSFDLFCEASAKPLNGSENIIHDIIAKDTESICRLTMMFIQKLDMLKSRRGVLEFSDIERLVYKLMQNEDIHREYQNKYDEVLIDEYQDVNALQDAIFTSISNGSNMFMVGDMKQSIYRFRNSDPTIFKNRAESYNDEYNRVINLNYNYRSRKNVLDSINNVFSVIMSEKAGEINYDESQQLNAGDLNYENANELLKDENSNFSEMIYVKHENSEDSIYEPLSDIEAEAEYIASRIRRMIDSGFKVRTVSTSADGKQIYSYRNASPRDFVILASSVTRMADIYINALEKYGLSCYAEATGYFNKSEITSILSLISVIDNPYNDISLAAVMKLPVIGFSDDELAEIRIYSDNPYQALYDSVCRISKSDTVLGEKCAGFLCMLQKWRSYAKIMSCDKLIWTLYEETDIYSYYGTLRNGEEAQANLRMLHEQARSYEKSGFKGLFNFIRYMERLQVRSEDLSPAKLLSEEHDVVRIMTMHKSKGLEFPIVFIAGAGTQFNFKNKSKFKSTSDFSPNLPIYFHKDKGIGLRYVNLEGRYSIPTPVTKEIEYCTKIETIAERMRLLYVAMTRAKEKLIIVSSSNSSGLNLSWKDNSSIVNSAKSFYDWLEPITKADKLWKFREVSIESETSIQTESKKSTEYVLSDDIMNTIQWKYQYAESTKSAAKTSVSELKRKKLLAAAEDSNSARIFDKAQIRKRPSFMEEQAPLTPAQKGTVVHYLLQTLPADATKDVIARHIEKLVEKRSLTQREAQSVDIDKLSLFFNTDLAERIRNSDKVYREMPFEIAVSSKELYGFDGDDVIVQGIIDCYFEENGEIVLVDYKTDRYSVGKTQDIIDKYRVQLNAYANAIEKITKKRVKSKYLYLFFHNDVVECN